MADLADLSLLYPKLNSSIMTATERTGVSMLVVDTESGIRSSLRTALVSAGYSSITDAASHSLALQKIQEVPCTHIIFEAKRSTMPVQDFLAQALETNKELILIPSSYEPTVDQVFNLLILGARGFLVKPFTSGSVDESIVMATKGEPISDSVISAKTTNEALAMITLSALNRLTKTMRQAPHFETARREMPKRILAVRRAIELGRTFSQGGEVLFRDALMEACIARVEGKASRIGQVRRRADEKRASAQRSSDEPDGEEAELETEFTMVEDLLSEQEQGF